MPAEAVGEFELLAYLDDALDLSTRLEVETFLMRNPAVAARIMGDLRARTALRLMEADTSPVPDHLLPAARRLSARLGHRPARGGRFRIVTLATGAAAALLVVSLLPDAMATARAPAYASDAAMAHRTGLIRAGMLSQPEVPVLDAAEIRAAMHVRVPNLPAGWRVVDVQIFPSKEGPALQIMIRSRTQGEMSIFAVRGGSGAPRWPQAVRFGDTSVAYWQRYGISYALAGRLSPDAIDTAAEDLADNRLG